MMNNLKTFFGNFLLIYKIFDFNIKDRKALDENFNLMLQKFAFRGKV